MQTQVPLPSTWLGETGDGFKTADISLEFNSSRPKATFGLLMRTHDRAEDVGAAA